MLNISNLVNATVNLTPQSAPANSFGVLLIAGDSDVIDGVQRFRQYFGIEAVAVDFGTNSPEYKAAALYFGQTPQPPSCLIGRWFSEASAAFNNGGILSPTAQTLSHWTTITNGSFVISVDGVSYTLTGLDFSAQTNLNGVASIITTGLTNAGSSATCVWTGLNFEIISGITGAGVKASGSITFDGNPSYGVQPSGTITLTGQPSNGDHVDIGGTTVTFVSGTPSGNQVQIGGTDLITAANLQAFLQASSDSNLSQCTYSTIGLVTTITDLEYGTDGNTFVLTKSGANITVSGSGTLAGGVDPDSVTLNGFTFTWVPPTRLTYEVENPVVVGPTAFASAANLLGAILASSSSDLTVATYNLNSPGSNIIDIVYKTTGTAGNAYSLSQTGTDALIFSGGTLSGGALGSSVGYATNAGSGTAIAAQLELTSSTSQALIPGFDAETPVACETAILNLTQNWYGLMFAATASISNDESLDVSAFTEALGLAHLYGVTVQDSNALSSESTSDLGYQIQQAGYNQSFAQYSSTNAYAVASLFGRALSVDYTQPNATIILMFKQEPGVVAENLSAEEAQVLKQKNYNVFVDYTTGSDTTTLIQYGTVASGQFIDTIQGCGWFQNASETAVFNELITTGKVPQTDPGVNQLVTQINSVCAQAVTNGFAAPGKWDGPSFGNLETGQYLKLGYYTFAESVNLQSEADRQARKCPPITTALKLAGGIQSVQVTVNVNQ